VLFRSEQIIFYDRKGSKFKTLKYIGYELFQDRYWFPKELHMSNHQSNKETRILFDEYNFDSKLKENDFTQVRLKSAR